MNITLADIGSLASILGFVLTIFILLALRSIRRSYRFTARVPELIAKLINHAGEIAVYQKEFSYSHQEIQLELAKIEVALKSLKKKVGRNTKSSINKLLKNVENYSNNSNDPKNLREIYVEMHKLISEIQELQSDLKWER